MDYHETELLDISSLIMSWGKYAYNRSENNLHIRDIVQSCWDKQHNDHEAQKITIQHMYKQSCGCKFIIGDVVQSITAH